MNFSDSIKFPCGLLAKNSLVLAPLTNGQSHPDGTLSNEEFRWLESRAEGGFGTVITCATNVSKHGQGWAGELGCYDDRHIAGLARISKRLRELNCRSIVQIFHGGARSPSSLTGERPRSASEFDLTLPGFERPRVMTEVEIEAVIEDFGRAAERACEAGCDGVEIHGANGYLLTQFLSTLSNRRTDSWGGSQENRRRLIERIFARVRKALGPARILGVRISPEDSPTLGGIDIDEMLALAKVLAKQGADYIHLSLWNARKYSDKYGEQRPPVVSQYRAELGPAVHLMTAGKIWDRKDVEEVIGLGANLIAIGAAAIANPEWPRQLIENPSYVPDRFPLTRQQLLSRHVSTKFVDYLRPRKWVANEG